MPRLKTRAAPRAAGGRLLRASLKLVRAAVAAPRTRPPAKPASRNRPTGRFVTVGGLRVHVIVRGRGRPVVLLHGNGTMAEDFAISGLIDRLAAHYRVIAIDRPGFGHTPRPRAQAWTPLAQAQLVGWILTRLRAERPVIVGHSWGTLVALALAAAGGRSLRGLVLLSGYYFPSARADAFAAAPLALPGLGDALRFTASPVVGRIVAQDFIRRAFKPRPVPTRFTARYPYDIAAGPEQQRAIAEDAATLPTAAAGLSAAYPSLRLPVTILTGGADAVIDGREQSQRLHRAVPGSRIEVLDDVGHMIHYAARGRNRVLQAVDDLMGRRAKA